MLNPIETAQKYSEEIRCPNCNNKEWHNIPMGETIISYKKRNKCKRCGCKLNGIAYGI